jgi:hypothetical protein
MGLNFEQEEEGRKEFGDERKVVLGLAQGRAAEVRQIPTSDT